MYISKLLLNPGSYQVQKDIGNPYLLHKTILRAFPDDIEVQGIEERVLYRLSTEKSTFLPYLLIQSFNIPNWDFLKEVSDYLLKEPQVKEFKYPQFKSDANFYFRLFCNPTKKSNGKRVGMYREEDQFEWLKRKGKLNGFKIIHATLTQKKELVAREKKGNPQMTFQSVLFEGVLRIEDPQTFLMALKKGIGSGKAFGCGFLTIAKL